LLRIGILPRFQHQYAIKLILGSRFFNQAMKFLSQRIIFLTSSATHLQ
jgi:hypothetical protein